MMFDLKRLVVLLALFGGLTVALGACDNTIRGIGQDIKDSTDAVKDST